MRILIVIFICSIISCSESSEEHSQKISDSTIASIRTNPEEAGDTDQAEIKDKKTENPIKADPAPEETTPSTGKQVYSNKRFRNVIVINSGNGNYAIQGEGQIFEASFSWVIEDGHKEIKKGFEMTDAGAPEWGKFHFTVNVRKTNPNSTLHLILFEISAKDGSRQHELPIPLP